MNAVGPNPNVMGPGRPPTGSASGRIRRLLEEHREKILAIARRHGAHHVRVFGSVARGDEGPRSDLDLLVRFEPDAPVFARLDLAEELSRLVGVRVEVVKEEALHRVIRDDVLREAVAV